MEHLRSLRVRNYSPRSIQQREYALGRIARAFDISPMGPALLKLTAEDLAAWQDSIVNYSPRYRQVWSVHVRQFYRWAHANDLIRVDPSRALLTVRIPRGVPHPISEDDLEEALFNAPPRIRPWLILAAYAGLRAAEIASLRCEDVRFRATPPVLVVTGKGNKTRIVPLSKRVADALVEAGVNTRRRGFAFEREDGQHGANTPGRVSKMANRYLHDLGIPDSLHSLRHRFGSQMYAVSRDIRMTQEVMGHNSPTTTAGYVAWSHSAATDAVEAIALDPARVRRGGATVPSTV